MQSFLTPMSPMTALPTHQLQVGAADPVRAAVGHLLSRAYSLPCSTAAQAFTQLVQPTSRFQLALDVLLPLLDPNMPAELAQRILVSFILYSLYAPHPIAINPFKSVLHLTFVKEREKAVNAAGSGGVNPNEQFVWVLWKILKGDGNDIGPYSPNTLARSPLPPKLRATNLLLDDETYNNGSELDDSTYSHPIRRDNFRPKSASSDLNEANGDTTTTHTATLSDTSLRTQTQPLISAEEDTQNENIAHAMKLLLAARERVLTLSEQRHLAPLLPQLTSPQMITTLDLAPIISHNPTLAHPLFVALLTCSNDSDIPSLFLDVLPYLPPTLPTFDLMGRLLRDPTPTSHSTIADLVRMEVLGRFIHESINWLDHAEREEKDGLISDDRFDKGVRNLCRFYNSLIKLSIVDPSSDADSAEMAHFSLRNSRFEEANALYRVLVMGKF